MGFVKSKPAQDPQGHSARVYDFIMDSPAYAALSPHDVLAYLALLRELKNLNNGDLSLPLTRSKKYGIGHHVTLARALRALCAVGLVAITRKGGCDKGGHREPTLYRVTHRDSFERSNKLVEAVKESNEWRRVTSEEHGRALIQAAENKVKAGTAKTKSAGHVVTATVSPCVLVVPQSRTRGDTWADGPLHALTMAEEGENPASMRVTAGFSVVAKGGAHGTRDRPPLYPSHPYRQTACTDGHGAYQRLRKEPVGLFVRLLVAERLAA